MSWLQHLRGWLEWLGSGLQHRDMPVRFRLCAQSDDGSLTPPRADKVLKDRHHHGVRSLVWPKAPACDAGITGSNPVVHPPPGTFINIYGCWRVASVSGIACLAQLGERRLETPKAPGSKPGVGTHHSTLAGVEFWACSSVVERLAGSQEVRGSIPRRSTSPWCSLEKHARFKGTEKHPVKLRVGDQWDCSSNGRAPVLHSGGCGFESRLFHRACRLAQDLAGSPESHRRHCPISSAWKSSSFTSRRSGVQIPHWTRSRPKYVRLPHDE